MAIVTLQVLEGLERGRIYRDLPTPITIGREEENTIHLRDEQVSRLHVKLQEENGRVILTDVDSTNGTRVNGLPVKIRVLQVGDLLSVGRCLLVFGSPDDISAEAARRMTDTRPVEHSGSEGQTISVDFRDRPDPAEESEAGTGEEIALSPLVQQPPDPPDDLTLLQKAAISDFLAYLHAQLAEILREPQGAPPSGEESTVGLGWVSWQQLLKLEMDLAVYMKSLAEPEPPNDHAA